MIDYYYEFPDGLKLFGEPVRYALQRGFHPGKCSTAEVMLHNRCYIQADRVWIENNNGLTLIREHGYEVHKKCDSKELTWIKLQARELEV